MQTAAAFSLVLLLTVWLLVLPYFEARRRRRELELRRKSTASREAEIDAETDLLRSAKP